MGRDYADGLVAGDDFRRPELRRAVFLRFWEFHLRYRAHPGCVYFLFPYMRRALGWSDEQALWFAFINGNTQHPPTSLLIHQAGPDPQHAEGAVDFWRSEYARLAFDTDRRYHKKSFDLAVAGYLTLLRGRSQQSFWSEAASIGWPEVWKRARAIPTFGRLSAWSYSEYLRIMGVPTDSTDLMLADSGSTSHRNGLCKVIGQDAFDWHSSNPGFDGTYSPRMLASLEQVGKRLLIEMRVRARGEAWLSDVTNLTLESALCTFKSWFRENRRYPGVYCDMLYDRLRLAERDWGMQFEVLWQARRESLPVGLRLEDSPNDPGCVPAKQNHFRETGHVINMDIDWPLFRCCWRDAVEEGRFGRRAA